MTKVKEQDGMMLAKVKTCPSEPQPHTEVLSVPTSAAFAYARTIDRTTNKRYLQLWQIMTSRYVGILGTSVWRWAWLTWACLYFCKRRPSLVLLLCKCHPILFFYFCMSHLYTFKYFFGFYTVDVQLFE